MLNDLIKVFTEITEESEMDAFFHEIFTEKELKDMALRWRLMNELHQGLTQRKIAEKHHISLCKITRGSRILKKTDSVTRKYLIK